MYPIKTTSKYNAQYGISDILPEKHLWPNYTIANYYGIDTIHSVDKDKWERVYQHGDINLMKTIDIHKYLELLLNDDYLVFISSNDDTSEAIDENAIVSMQKLGLQADLRDKFRWSYLAIIDQGKVVFEEHKEGPIITYGSLKGINYHIESSGKVNNKDNISVIKLNDTEYSQNRIGLNIVVYDVKKGQIVDSVNFNTWDDLSWHR